MPNLLSLSIRSIKNKIRNNNLKLPFRVNGYVISPGGCGTVTLKNFLENYTISNNHIEKEYRIFNSSHIIKPPKSFKKDKIKVIIIKRDLDDIYQSLKKRGFLRNSLIHYGDIFPYMYINIFQNEELFKKKFLKYLRLFYSNWENYPPELKIVFEYEDLYTNKLNINILEKFLNINDLSFRNKFPVHKRYEK